MAHERNGVACSTIGNSSGFVLVVAVARELAFFAPARHRAACRFFNDISNG